MPEFNYPEGADEDTRREWFTLFAEAAMLSVAITNSSKCEEVVFFNFSGHVNWLSISIRKSKQNYNEYAALSESHSLFSAGIERFRDTVEVLRRLYREGELPMELLQAQIVEVVEYEF